MSDDATKQDKPARQSQPRIVALPDFGPRYRVIGAIGKGGMGEVFRAFDNELDGEVALKIVRDDIDSEGALARFRREIALARKVTSPNVLRVYDLDEHDGLRFLSMEYVDGQDLGAVMRKDGKMPIDQAITIFRQVCQGLAAAHAEGVVHRDLKPQNVLVDSEGRVRVADFGLARSIGESGLTASGAVLGSPAYMSPEQVKGDPTDERSDIYSLGIMLYQLVTGETPFKGDSPHSVMEMRLHKRAALLGDVRPDAPPYLEGICAKCLALAPSARFASVKDVLAALDTSSTAMLAPRVRRPRWIAPAVAGVIVAGTGAAAYVLWPHRHEAPTSSVASAPPPAADTPLHATKDLITAIVFDADNRTGDPLFDPTISTVLSYALRMSKRIDPISGSYVLALATELGLDKADDRIARKLFERDHIPTMTVHASIAAKGTAFAITVTASDGRTGQQMFTKTVDATSLDAVIPTVARLASSLRESVGEPIKDEEREQTGTTSSLEAAHAYAVGRAASRIGDNEHAITELRIAVAKDPQFALAHDELALHLMNVGKPAEAQQEFQLGLRWIDRLGERERLGFLGDYHLVVSEERDRSIAAYEQMLQTWPKDSGSEVNVAVAYLAHGEAKKALEKARLAAADHPHEVVSRGTVAMMEIAAGEYAQAVAETKRLLADFPRSTPTTYEYLGLAYAFLGQRAAAAEAFDKYVLVNDSAGKFMQADFALSEGRVRDARKLLETGIADDVAHKDLDGAEVKRAALAELEMRHGDKGKARTAAELVTKDPLRVLEASLVELGAGDDKPALATATKFATELSPVRRAYGKLIEAEALRVHGKAQQAVIAFREAQKISETPMGHFLLARAALEAKAYPEAYTELQLCVARKGEAAFGIDDVPSYRYVPLFTYYLAKAQEGLGSPDAAKSYAAFLAMTHEPDADDPMVADAKKHVP